MGITSTDLINFLETVPGFQDLPKGDLLQKIVPIIGVSHFDAGQTIIKCGDMPHTLFIIYEGRVHGHTEAQGEMEHHFFVDRGNVIGEAALVSNRRHGSSVLAATPTICLTLDVDSFQQIMIRDWRFAKAFFILVGQRIIDCLVKTEIVPFQWTDKYRIGIPEVDDQHKRLFEIINQLGEFLDGDRDPDNQNWDIQNFFVEIMSYVDKHFQDEERLMDNHGADWLGSHKKIHLGFAKTVSGFQNKILALSNRDEQIHILEQVYKLLGNWLVTHIMKEDVRFGDFYKALTRQSDAIPAGPDVLSPKPS